MPKSSTSRTVINNKYGADVFVVKVGGSLTIKSGSRNESTLVIDGGGNSSHTLFRLYNNTTLNIENGVTIRRFNNAYDGSVVYAEGSKVNLKGCVIEYNSCKRGTVFLTSGCLLKVYDEAVFRQNITSTAGSAIYVNTANDKVYLNDTEIYKNFCSDKDTGSTIYVNAGYISIGDGTSIINNESDWYDIYSAMYISADARADFEGDVDITNLVTAAGKVYISPELSGILRIRGTYDFTTQGKVFAESLGGSFTNEVFNTVEFFNASYSLAATGESLVVTQGKPLLNTSTISATELCLGSSVTVNAQASSGTGGYTYAVYYKKATDNNWTTKQSFSSNNTVSFKPSASGTYKILVKVKDSIGSITEKIFDLLVTEPLSNNSSVNSLNIFLGDKIVINGSASGGAGDYSYAMYYKKSSSATWINKQDFSKNESVSIKPTAAVAYDIKVEVKDGAGTVVPATFRVNVSEAVQQVLANTSSISATEVTSGTKVTLKGAANGGTSPYFYSFYYKKASDKTWNVLGSEYTTANTASFTPNQAVVYDIRIVVIDSTGESKEKCFTLSVKDTPALKNNSKISVGSVSYSDSQKINVTIGSNVTITGAAGGGTAPYKYAFYFKRTANTKWNQLSYGNEKHTYAKFTPTAAAQFDLKVIATDKTGTKSEKIFKINVTE